MINELKITVLCDNKVGKKGLLAEHGLSFALDCDGEKILFDTGQGYVLKNNANVLQTNLKDFNKVVLSHGHYDHTGGLMTFAKENSKAKIYAHPDVFLKRYVKENKGFRDCGIPFTKKELEEAGFDFSLSSDTQEISPGLILAGQVPRNVSMRYPTFVCPVNEGWEEDKLLDDQFLLASTTWGEVLILGCTHSGLENTLLYAKELSGGKDIKAVIGGMHLVNTPLDEMDKHIKILKEMKVEYVIPMHCSGFYAMAELSRIYREKFIEGKVGITISFSDKDKIVTGV